MKIRRLLFALVCLAVVVVLRATVPNSTTWVQYVLSTNPQTLPVPFVFQNPADLLVVDSKTSPPTTLSLNSDYSVTGGLGSTGNVITMSGGAHGVIVGAKLTISRKVPLTQTVTFSNGGPLTAQMIGQAFDKVTQISQQLNLVGANSLQFQGDEAMSGVLPKTARSGNLLGFDANGNVRFYTPGSVGPPPPVITGFAVPTIQALRSTVVTGLANLSVLYVANYSLPDDGGGGVFQYSSSSTAFDNGGTIIQPTAGAGRWLRLFSGATNVRWFGAKGDNSTDDTAAINGAIASLGGAPGQVFVPIGNYITSGSGTILTLAKGQEIVGDSNGYTTNGGSKIVYQGSGTLLTIDSNCRVANIQFLGNSAVFTGSVGIAFTSGASQWVLSAAKAYNFETNFLVRRVTSGSITDCVFSHGTVNVSIKNSSGLLFSGGTIEAASSRGAYLSSGFSGYAAGIVFNGVSFTGNANAGLEVSGGGGTFGFPGLRVTGCTFTANGDGGDGGVDITYIDSSGGGTGAGGATFDGNTFSGAHTSLFLGEGVNPVIFGNSFLPGGTVGTRISIKIFAPIFNAYIGPNWYETANTIVDNGINTRYYTAERFKPAPIAAGDAINFAAAGIITGGTGSPEGVVSAPVGSVYERADGSSGTSVYIKESGSSSTGWTALAPSVGTGNMTAPSVSTAAAKVYVTQSGSSRNFVETNVAIDPITGDTTGIRNITVSNNASIGGTIATQNVTANGTIDFSTAGSVIGTWSVPNGGSGRNALTAKNLLLGNGTSAVNFLPPGTSGNVVTSNGTDWVSSPSSSTIIISGTPSTGQTAEWTAANSIGGVSTSGTGSYAKTNSPTFVTPSLGVATATSVNGLTPTAQSVGFTIAGGTTSKTLTVPNTASVSGTNTGDQNASARVVYTSETCVSDADLSLGSSTFGTDNTAALQAILDLAATAPLHMIVDGKYSCTGLKVRSNTQITGLPGCGLILRSAADVPLLENYNRNNSNLSIRDHDMIVERIILNGNEANESHEESGYTGTFLCGMTFAKVDNVKFLDLDWRNAKTFSILLGWFSGADIERIKGTHSTDYVNTDLVHIWGPGTGQLIIRDCESDGKDDIIAINNDELYGSSPEDPNWETYGGLDNVLVENIRSNGANQGVRLLDKTYRVETFVCRNITGTVGSYAFLYSPISDGPGNVGSLTVDGVDVKLRSLGNAYSNSNAGATPLWNVVAIDGTANSVSLKNIFCDEFGDTRPIVFLGPLTIVGAFSIDGLFINDTTNSFQTNTQGRIMATGSTLPKLNVSNVVWTKLTSGSPTGILVMDDGSTITDLDVSTASLVDAQAVVKSINSGVLTNLVLESVRLRLGGSASVQADGTNLVAASYIGPTITSGTWTHSDTAAAIIEASGPPSPDLLWYKTNEGSGTTLADSSAAGNPGTTNAGWEAVTGGSRLTFNGTTQFASSNSSVSISAYSVITQNSWWVLNNTSTTQVMVALGDVNSQFGTTIIFVSSGKISVGAVGPSGAAHFSDYTAPSTGVQTMITAVFDVGTAGGANKVYYNGALQTPVSSSGSSTSGNFTNRVAYLGRHADGTDFTGGKMDDFRIWSGEVSSADIAAIYALGPQ